MRINNVKLGIFGAGNMAGAILNAILKNEIISPDKIFIFDKIEEKSAPYKDSGVHICGSLSEVARCADMSVIAIKPQDVPDLLTEIKDLTTGKCILSIAAGIGISYLKEKLAAGTFFIRVMPNTPFMISCGAAAISFEKDTPIRFKDAAESIFSSAGIFEIIDESHMNEIISVNGSSPAYFYKMIAAIAKSAKLQGIDPSIATKLAAKTMEGAARMILQSEKSVDCLISQVTSRGGTTIEAIGVMEREDFDGLIHRAMTACTKRAYELQK